MKKGSLVMMVAVQFFAVLGHLNMAHAKSETFSQQIKSRLVRASEELVSVAAEIEQNLGRAEFCFVSSMSEGNNGRDLILDTSTKYYHQLVKIADIVGEAGSPFGEEYLRSINTAVSTTSVDSTNLAAMLIFSTWGTFNIDTRTVSFNDSSSIECQRYNHVYLSTLKSRAHQILALSLK